MLYENDLKMMSSLALSPSCLSFYLLNFLETMTKNPDFPWEEVKRENAEEEGNGEGGQSLKRYLVSGSWCPIYLHRAYLESEVLDCRFKGQ